MVGFVFIFDDRICAPSRFIIDYPPMATNVSSSTSMCPAFTHWSVVYFNMCVDLFVVAQDRLDDAACKRSWFVQCPTLTGLFR